ncbi:hypothetical protein QCN35_gp65 [Arthrobacter phage Synepsis]|nr:hypothetical protein QCN35_gp65 [Arthrobacter phage Synepsis]AXH46746.1 hypothetical protein SEA_SYNEPSIS_65 [Arthrobacter phage Synepsis]
MSLSQSYSKGNKRVSNNNHEPKVKIPSTTKKPHRPRVEGLFAVLRIRERELLTLQGHCVNTNCRLHKDHVGPCDERKPKE